MPSALQMQQVAVAMMVAIHIVMAACLDPVHHVASNFARRGVCGACDNGTTVTSTFPKQLEPLIGQLVIAELAWLGCTWQSYPCVAWLRHMASIMPAVYKCWQQSPDHWRSQETILDRKHDKQVSHMQPEMTEQACL